MADKPAANPNAAATDQPKHTDAQLEAARTEARAEGVKAGTAEGTKTERDRVRGIMTHAEAKERQELALSIATETDMGVEQAAKLLAAAPKQASKGALAALMAQEPNPKVGVDGDLNAGAAKPKISTSAIYDARRQQNQARSN